MASVAYAGVDVAQPDVTLILDLDGIIQEATLSGDASAEAVDTWRGRPWTETVADPGGTNILSMLQDARETGVSAYRQINQRFPSGLELPLEYTTARFGHSAGLIAIGRNLSPVSELQSRLLDAQQAMEQDYWKLREAESRYRLLFDSSNEAVLTLNAETLRIVEANPAAIRMLGLARGRDILTGIGETERAPFKAMLSRVRQHGRAPSVLVRVGATRETCIAKASVISSEPETVFLLQLAPAATPRTDDTRADPLSLDDIIERLPGAFVVIDRAGIVRRANLAFLDLIQAETEATILGERIGRWLTRPSIDLPALIADVNRDGIVRQFPSVLRGTRGQESAVEIAAAGNSAGHPTYIALLLRDVSRRGPAYDNPDVLQAALSAIIERASKTSLPALVRNTIGLLERHYIGAALDLAAGNRTVAAEILGLSRQGLYKKLAHYELAQGEYPHETALEPDWHP